MKKRVTRISLSICLALLWLSNVAMVNAAPAAEPTFTTDSWRLSSGSSKGGVIDKGSPTLADLTGDGVPEVLIGTTARNGTGGYNKATLLVALTRDAGSPGGMKKLWAVNVGAPINSTPAVGDIDGDGNSEVVVSVGGDVADLNHYGGVRAYNRYGGLLWYFDTHDRLDSNGYPDGVFSSPTLCDVDADGDLEIAFGGWDHRIYLLDHEGNSLWNPHNPPYGDGYYSQDTIWSSPACADLNQDGYREIIIGADITNGTFLDGQPAYNGGLLYIFNKNGDVLVRRYLPRAIYASPAVGDLDGDGDMEIVSGTSFASSESPPYVYVFSTDHVFNDSMNYYDPAKLPHAPGWPYQTDYPGFSSPALADLDGDGDLEIVIGTAQPSQTDDPVAGEGSVYAWHHNGQLVTGWPVHPKNLYNWDTYIASSPTIADVDNDGELEILFSMMEDVQVYNTDGTPQALEQQGIPSNWCRDGLLKTPQWVMPIWGSPAVGDADGDGKVEVWIGGPSADDPSTGYLWRFESDQNVGAMPWPMFHRDAQNRGSYAPPKLGASPISIYAMHEYGSGSSENDTVFVFNGGEGEIDWMATSPSAVTLSTASGTVDGGGQLVTATISTSGYVTGTHSLGNIVITGTVGGETAAGSPVSVPVTLYVGPVHRTCLPLVINE